MKIEHKIFEAEVKAFDDENLILEHFISTEHKDRGGDIMRAKGMKIVGKPVVLMLHGRGPMSYEPIGKPLSLTVDEFKGEPGILAKTQFFNDEVGQRLYAKAKGGFLPNWSIGYSVDEAKDLLREGRYDGRDVTKWQLLEYSPVGVPMNPFAQTVKEFKEFLERTEKLEGPFQVPESHWFGVVDEKTCTGCGACEGKHGECSECKGPMTHFMKEGKHIGSTCEKCEPEKFAELTKAIAPPELPPEDPLKAINEKIDAIASKAEATRIAFVGLDETVMQLNDVLKKLEPLLATLPPEPDGGDKGKEGEGNPPDEKKTPPRLVVVRDEDTPEGKRAAQNARILAIAREAVREAAKQEIDRMKGRVP
jgi:hypothetical protein